MPQPVPGFIDPQSFPRAEILAAPGGNRQHIRQVRLKRRNPDVQQRVMPVSLELRIGVSLIELWSELLEPVRNPGQLLSQSVQVPEAADILSITVAITHRQSLGLQPGRTFHFKHHVGTRLVVLPDRPLGNAPK